MHVAQEQQHIAAVAQSVLHKGLGLKAYKVQLKPELTSADHQQRRVFADWVLEMHENDPEFDRKFIITDEAHFNKQNCRIWDSEKPRVIVEKPHHPQRLTVWCGLGSGGVIAPYFFENEVRSSITVNGLRYRVMINDFLWAELDGIDLENRKGFRTVISLEEVITIGHRDLVI